jgi:hypothetical protein
MPPTAPVATGELEGELALREVGAHGLGGRSEILVGGLQEARVERLHREAAAGDRHVAPLDVFYDPRRIACAGAGGR